MDNPFDEPWVQHTPEEAAAWMERWRAWNRANPRPYDRDDAFEPDDSGATRELTDGEYDRVADNYERNWV